MATTAAIALSYLSPYKPDSLSSITKDLESSNTQPRSYMIQHTSHILHKFTIVQHTSEYEELLQYQVEIQ